MKKGSILVIRGGAIGDFILTLPVLAALRQQFPETGLEVLGYSHIARLALAGGLVDAVRSIEARALAGFFARGGDLDPELSKYFARFAIVISYLYDPDQIFRDNVARCSKAQFIVGPHRPSEMGGLHATEVFLRPLERLAIFAPDPVPRLCLRQSDRRSPEACDGSQIETLPTLALHPGSGSERKNWPEEKWAQLLQNLAQTPGLNFLLVGGEAEGNKFERLAVALPTGRLEIARNLPLPDLAQHLAGCSAFIGHDSGISHLAAALGLPCLVLWGESVEAVWRPRNERVKLLRAPKGVAGITVEEVLNEIRSLLFPHAN